MYAILKQFTVKDSEINRKIEWPLIHFDSLYDKTWTGYKVMTIQRIFSSVGRK